jgi:hypothetical protein
VPAGDQNGSFTVTVTWQEPLIDLRRLRLSPAPERHARPRARRAVASTPIRERATRFEAIAGDPIKPAATGSTSTTGAPTTATRSSSASSAAFCQAPEAPLTNSDEDDFIGPGDVHGVQADNKLPSDLLAAGQRQDQRRPSHGLRAGRSDGSISHTRSTSTATGASSTTTAKNGHRQHRFPERRRLPRRRPRGATIAAGKTAYAKQAGPRSRGPSSGTDRQGGPTLVKSFKLNRP